MHIRSGKQLNYTTYIFAAAACLSVFSAALNDARACVVWSGVQDIRVGPAWLPSYGTWVLDLNTDGVGDFRFDFTELSDFVVSTLADNAVTTQDHHPMLEIWDSWPLAEGVRLDAALDAVTRWGSNDYVLIDWESSGGELVGVGPWAGVEYAYMGMQFHTSNGIHYGWARISVYDAVPGMIIHDWAYEKTPHAAITTGATGRHYVSQAGDHLSPFISWESAATNIQAAVDVAADGHVVIITNGTYTVTNEITVTNGVTLQSFAGAAVTTVAGGYPTTQNRCFYLNHSNAVVSGFTISNGWLGDFEQGAGVLCDGGGLVEDCILTGNFAWEGGGVALLRGGHVQNCTFTSNYYTRWGSGAYLYKGGLIESCTFSDNEALRQGGGAYLDAGGAIRNSLFSGNRAIGGGGVYMRGGGRLENCTAAGNTAYHSGGGISCDLGGEIINTVIYHNTASNGPNWELESTDSNFVHCCADPMPPGWMNITNDPGFESTPSGDYHLTSNSPCVDTGSNMPAVTDDIDGIPRPLDGDADLKANWDIGAYEYISPFADTDGDGLTDTNELDGIGTSPINADTDADQMPDGWEVDNMLNPLVDDADQDPDFDTMNNGGEYVADTDPHDPQSILSVINVAAEHGGIRIDWKGGRDAWQILECHSDLSSTADQWTAILGVPPPTPLTNAIIDLGATNRTLFYRIRATRWDD